MLPFNKRPRSEIEIQPDEIEPVQLPPVRPPSVRPSAGLSSRALPAPSPSVRPAPAPRASVPAPKPSRPPISFRPVGGDDEERTTFMADKAPRRQTLDLRQPSIPQHRAPRIDSFGDEEATRLHPSNSSRSLISMNAGTAQRLVADDSSGHVPAVSHSVVPEAPKSAAAVDMGMTVATRTRDLGRPTAIWAAALVAIGVFTGLASALVARGGSDSLVASSAALIDPSLASTNVAAGGAGKTTTTQQVAPVQPAVAVAPAAASCADSVTTTTKVEPKAAVAAVVEPVVDEPAVAKPAVAKPAAVAAPPPVHVASNPKPYVAPTPKPYVAPKPKPYVAPTPKPVAAAKPKTDLDSASAADALAKAQLEAALNR